MAIDNIKIGSKKGIFFTIVSILLSGLFITAFIMTVKYTYTDKMSVTETRVKTMDLFIKSIERDAERELYISSFRAILSIDNYVVSKGQFVSDVNTVFTEAVMNGTINDAQQSLMTDSTISDWVQRVKLESAKIGIAIDVNFSSIEISQKDPWTVQVNASADFLISDTKNTASWERSKNINTEISIVGFEDPVFAIKSNGHLSRNIEKTNTTSWDVQQLRQHLINRTYAANSNAPDFLMRLEGNLSSSLQGIETLVDGNELVEYGINPLTKTAVDYIYWSANATTDYEITGITDAGYPYFMLDEGHLDFYDVESYAVR